MLSLSLISGGAAPAALQWTLQYPAVNVLSISASAGPSATSAGKILNCVAGSGFYTCLASGLNNSIISNGIVVYVNLTLAATVRSTSIGVGNTVASSSSGSALPIAATGAIVTGPSILTPLTITMSPQAATLTANQTQQFTAAVTGGPGNTAVSWSINPAVGTISAAGLYTAPASVPSPQLVTVTATSAADSSQSASANITLQPPPSATGASATFVSMDWATKGSWMGMYGGDGYVVVGGQSSNPAYVNPVPAGAGTAVWASSTADQRALQKPSNPADRIAASWFNWTPFTIDLNISDTAQHQIALYCLDWDWLNRRQTVDILDGNGNVLSTESLTTSFGNGVYLVWNVRGHVTIRVTWTGGGQGVVSGLFFGTPAAGNTPAAGGTPVGSATFVSMDTVTNGSWEGVYGADGYVVVGDQSTNPVYANPVPAGAATAVWASSTTDPRALQKPSNPADRIAASWYNTTPFTIDLNISDTAQHQIALYCLDWDWLNRRQTVDILDGNGNVLNTQSLTTSFGRGVYLVWNVSGHVTIRVTWTGGGQAVVSGLFFDPVGSGAASPSTPLLRSSSLAPAGTGDFRPAVAPRQPGALSSLACSPRVAKAGSQVSCELRLAASPTPAPLALMSSSRQVRLPANIESRPYQSRLTFQASVDPVAKQQTAVVAAMVGESRVEDAITVAPADGPVLTAPVQRLAAWGKSLTFTVNATDPDDLPLQLASGRLPAGASFDAGSGRFSWIPTADQAGRHSIAFTATNSAARTTSAETMIEVDGGAPTLIAAQSVQCSSNSIAGVEGKWLSGGTVLSEPSGSAFALGGVAVRINGQAVPVLFSSATRVSFLCPALEPGTAFSLVVDTPGGPMEALTGVNQAATPAILSVDGAEPQQGMILFRDTAELAVDRNYKVVGHPAQPGDELVIWATGLGGASAEMVRVNMGGVYAQVEAVQPVSGHAGVSAIRVEVPASMPTGDALPVRLQVMTPDFTPLQSNLVTAAFESLRQ